MDVNATSHDQDLTKRPIEKRPKLTRAQEQARIDELFGMGKMSQAQWSDRFDQLCNLEIWAENGKL